MNKFTLTFSKYIFLILVCFNFFSIVPLRKEIKKAILILGSGRCGTSAMSGVLNILGVDFGPNLLEGDHANEKGYFEDKDTIEINKQILAEMGTYTSDIKPISFDFDSPKGKELKKKINNNLRKKFEKSKLFGLKDPRIALLLPLYIQVISEMGFEIYFIIMRRNVEEVIASFHQAYKMTHEYALALITKYEDLIEKDTKNYNKIIIWFNNFIQNQEEILLELKNFIPELIITSETKKLAAHFLDPNLVHHTFSKEGT